MYEILPGICEQNNNNNTFEDCAEYNAYESFFITFFTKYHEIKGKSEGKEIDLQEILSAGTQSCEKRTKLFNFDNIHLEFLLCGWLLHEW